MIVIYSEDFLEKLRRPSNIVTIGSYSLDFIPKKDVSSTTVDEFSKKVLTATPETVLKGTDLIGFWESDKKMFKIRVNFPDTYAAGPQTREVFLMSDGSYSVGKVYSYNTIRFFEDTGDLAFVIINNTGMDLLNDQVGQTRNLLNLQLPDDTRAQIRTSIETGDLKFLSSYGVDLGENLFKLDEAGNIMVTKESFYKMFSMKDSEMNIDDISFLRNDGPHLDMLGNKISDDYYYRVYKNLNIFCSGLEHECWIPTKYNLYRNYIDGGIKIYGTAEYDEYRVFGDTCNLVSTGTETLEHIPGIEFVEESNTGIVYRIDYGKQKIIYTKPMGDEDSVNMNAAVTLHATLRNYDGGVIKSESIRFYQGGREDEWKILTKSTEYYEDDIPVFLFQYNAGVYYSTGDSKLIDLYSHHMTITTTMEIKNKDSITVEFDNDLLSKYFEVVWKTKRIYDDLDPSIFKKTEIYVTLRPKKVNQDLVKWFPLNSKGESELMLATLRYDNFDTKFYMVQSPKVKGLKLYEFNPIGSNFSQVQSLEFAAIDKKKIYWMLTEEQETPKTQVWWKSADIKESSINHDLGISIKSEEYLSSDAFLTQDQEKIIYRNGYGLFTETVKMAMRADVEVGTNTSSFINKPDDNELSSGNKYLSLLDEFRIDPSGYITLGTSKLVSKEGTVQYEHNQLLTSKIGSSYVDLNSTPITKSITTYINNVGNTDTVSKNTAESARKANINSNTAYTLTNAKVPSAITTNASTDSRLISNELSLGQGASKYWISDSTVIGQFVKDTGNLSTSDITNTIGSALLDNEFSTSRYFDTREKSDTAISFIKEDGSIGYTSKEDGISVKVVTDSEGKLVKDPRKIWNNLKLRPVIIEFSKNPQDVNPLYGEAITFYRVSEEELSLDFNTDSWRNMVTRAQVSYEIYKKGQDPFIQIIEKLRDDDTKSWRYVDGKFENYIVRGSSVNIDTSSIERKPFIVRSNCPFKLTFKYNKGYENTLAFDKEISLMADYTISNDSQTLYSKQYDSVYGKGIYMDALESDIPGVIGEIVATYNDYSSESTVTSTSNSYDTATLVDKDGNIDKDALSKLVMVNRGVAKNIFAYSRRTLHNMFTPYVNVEDAENLTTYSASDIDRKSLSFQDLKISPANPYFNESGYQNHKITLDIERTSGSSPRFPINPIGQLSVMPYNSSRRYDRNSTKGVQYYVFENGIAPKLNVSSFPGTLGGEAVNLNESPEYFRTANIGGVKYSISPWGTDEVSGRTLSGGRVPVRWESTNANSTIYYTLTGSEIIDGVPSYKKSNTSGLEGTLFTCIENPRIWTKLDNSNLKVSNIRYKDGSISTQLAVKDSNVPYQLEEHYIDSLGGLITTASSLYKVSHKNFDEYWSQDATSTVTSDNANVIVDDVIALDYIIADVGTVAYVNNVKVGTSHIYILKRSNTSSFPRVVSGVITKAVKSSGNALLTIGGTRGGKTMSVNYFTDENGNYYIEDSSIKTAYLYNQTEMFLGNITYTTEPKGADNRTTFTITSNYPLQYIGYDYENGEYAVSSSPTKKYKIGQILGKTHSDAIEALNIPYSTESEIQSQNNREVRGRMYSELYDIDIHVKPEKESDKSLFKIDSIVGNLNTTGEYEYTITVAPTSNFNLDGKRYCGRIVINSRIRRILNNSQFLPEDLLNAYPKVLPLYDKGLQISGVTRPPKGLTWGSSDDASEYEYELVALPDTQKKIEKIVPSDEIHLDIYQQKSNYIQLYGDRSREIKNEEIRRFSTLYEPGIEYPTSSGDSIKLGSDTIQMRASDTGWSGRDNTSTYIAEVKDIETLAQHIPSLVGDVVKINIKDSATTSYYVWNGKEWTNTTGPSETTCTMEVSNESTIQTSLKRLNNVKSGDIYKVTPHEYASELSPYYEYNPSSSVGKIQIQVDNYNPNNTNKPGQPYALLHYNDIYSSYYPTKISLDQIQSGKIISKYSQGSVRDNLVNFTLSLGRWNSSSGINTVDELDYFIKGEELKIEGDYYVNLFDFNSSNNKVRMTEYDPDNNLYYVRWYKMEQSEGEYKRLEYYHLLLPQGIDKVNPNGYNGVNIDGMWVSLVYDSNIDRKSDYEVNGITLDFPLPTKYYFTEMSDSDTSINYFTDVRGKLLVNYSQSANGEMRLYGTSMNALTYWWKTIVPKLYQECISFVQPGIQKGLVCASQSTSPKLFLGEFSKNTIYEQISGKSTYIDIMAGVFELTGEGENSDVIDFDVTFHKEGTEGMPSTSVADREDWYEREYKDLEKTEEVTETINDINYSVWRKYENGLGTNYYILLNKKYDNLIKVDDEYVKYISQLDINNPDSPLKTIYPDYVMEKDSDGNMEFYDNTTDPEPLVDYEIVGGVERLYHSGILEYDKWVKYEGSKKFPGYYVLMNRNTDYATISLRNPKKADYTIKPGSEISDYVFVKYDYSHDDYIELSDETTILEGKVYSKWYKYEYNEDLGKFEMNNYKYYLFEKSTGPVRGSSNFYVPEYSVCLEDDSTYEHGASEWFDKEFLNSDGKIFKIYIEGAVENEYLYKSDSNVFTATGNTELNISRIDGLTGDWSYEVLKDSCYVDYEGNYQNNIRINFSNNQSEDDLIRKFKIEAVNKTDNTIHSVTLQITQNSYLGNIYCDDSINITSSGNYLGNYTGREIEGVKEIDPYFYFDTDIPSSELEFVVNEDPNASVILSMGDDTNSSYGADFKRYRLTIKLGKNLSRENKTRTLTITRYFSVYDDSENIILKKFKIIKKVKLVQGYKALYIKNPLYLQKKLAKALDTNNPIPEYLSTGGIIGSFSDPLVVPYSQYVTIDETTGMDYTVPIYYEQNEPSLDNDGDFVFEKYSRTKLLELLGDSPVQKWKWNIQSPNTSYTNIFEDTDDISKFGVSIIQDQAGLTTPCLVYRYDVKDSFLFTSVISYVEVEILTTEGNKYNFYIYMKKLNK